LSGCVDETPGGADQPKAGDTEIISEEPIEGIFNPILEYGKTYFNGIWYNYTKIRYIKDNVTYNTAFIESIIDSFDWVKNNTVLNSTILCWWDYGGMIEGYCEREAIAVYPSISLLDSIGDYGVLDEEEKERYIEEHNFSDNGTNKEIADVLTAENFSNSEVQDIIKKYNVSYIFTRSYDKKLAGIFLSAADKNLDDYFTDCDDKGIYCYGGTPTDKTNKTLIYKMWESEPDIPGLNLLYHFAFYGNNDPDINTNIVRVFSVVDFFSYASFSEAVSRLDTPTKVINYMNSYFNFTFHDGCVSYALEEFYELKEGDCKDYATFFSYVLDYHGFDADIVTFTFYEDDGTRNGHVVTLFNDSDGVLKYQSNGDIFGPVTSVSDLLEQEKIRLNVAIMGSYLVLDPGSTYCCSPD